MVKIKDLEKKDLPFTWREQVKEKLQKVGIEISVHKITDIKRGRCADIKLSETVLKLIREVKKEYDESKSMLEELQILP